MRRAVITGASGFIGSWLAQELLQANYEITLVVRNADRLLPELSSTSLSTIVVGELSVLTVEDFPFQNYDVFYHLSWSGVSADQKNDISLQISNIPMSISAMELCRKLGCRLFVSAGTVAEYALSSDVIDFSCRQTPNNAYSAAKSSAYYFLETLARKLGQPFIWAVIPSTFGERRTDNNIITYTIKTLLCGEKPHYGNLKQMWDFLYVSEVARALRLIGERGKAGLVYGIGSGQYRPLREYIMKVRDVIDPSLPLGIGDIPSFSAASSSSCVNIFILTRDTGFIPNVCFEDGVRLTVAYWRKVLYSS